MFADINTIKSVKLAKKTYEALLAAHGANVSAKQLDHNDWMAKHSATTMYKEGSLAWWKDCCRSLASNIVQKASVSSRFIPPSPETLAWGGFLGGETVVTTDESKKASATTEVTNLIRAIAA